MMLKSIQLLIFGFLLALPSFEGIGQALSQVSGYVFSPTEPLENVKVFLINKGQEALTDSNGEFLLNGSYKVGEQLKLLLLSAGHESKHIEVTINNTDQGKVGLFYLEPQKKVGLNILVTEDGQPPKLLNQVAIKANGVEYNTDAYGNVFIEINEELQKGEKPVILILKKEGYQDKVVSEFFAPGRALLEISMKKKSCQSSVIDTLNMQFTDCRDREVYRIRKIDGLIWMDENLRYHSTKSVLYNYEEQNQVYGRLYSWEEAQNICPSGWRLPTKAEYQSLIRSLGGKKDAYLALEPSPYILGGRRDAGGHFMHKDKYAYLWAGTSHSDGKAFYFGLGTAKRAYIYHAEDYEFMYCRCVKAAE